jgi:hypothetical protein
MATKGSITEEPALKTPRAAAAAGIIFSILMITSLGIVRFASTRYGLEPGAPPEAAHRHALRLALNLVPLAGIAFLWFIGALRNRVGKSEDQFFATVFLGSGLLFVANVFASASVSEALLESGPNVHSEVYSFARRVAYTYLNVFAIRMAAVFTFSTCAIALRTAILRRWVSYLGIACGVVLLLVISDWLWIALLFPLWTLLVSSQLLFARNECPR